MKLFNFFEWLATKAEQAILTGVGRAAARLDSGNTAGEDTALPDDLTSRLALPPAAGESQPRNGKRDKAAAS